MITINLKKIYMKRLILLVIMLLPMAAMANQPKFEELCEQYTNVEGVTAMNLDGKMIQMMAGEFAEATEFIENIIVIISKNKKQSNKIVKRSAKIIKKLKLKPILSANEEDSMVDIYCVGEGDVANDLIITVKKGDKGGVVVISGELSLETTGDIIEKMQ